MHLNDHSLRQIDAAYLRSWEPEVLCALSLRLLADLKEARDRLHQGPENSSRPPSRRAPWERTSGGQVSAEDPEDGERAPEPAEVAEIPLAATPPARKAGKQPGAPGMGRTQVFQVHEEHAHYPAVCAGCSQALDPAGAITDTGFQSVDLHWGDPVAPGLTLRVVDHRYYEASCACGHHTRARAGQGAVDPLLAGIELGEWRLVGPGLATLIVALAFRFRLSRARIQEFLAQWLGLKLSIGTLHQTIHEASAAIAPAEAELVQVLLDSALLHADETPWPAHGETLWLWVFQTLTVTLYDVAGHGKELLDNVLEGFHGWLMSDGWGAYHHYPRRLRCWAHLPRKARGLAESSDHTARTFGRRVLNILEVLLAAVYAAREGPLPVDLPGQHAAVLATWRTACEHHRGSDHGKTHALAVELLND